MGTVRGEVVGCASLIRPTGEDIVGPVNAVPLGRISSGVTGFEYLQEVMVVGAGLLSAARFTLRVVACGNAFSLALESHLGPSFLHPSPHGQNV